MVVVAMVMMALVVGLVVVVEEPVEPAPYSSEVAGISVSGVDGVSVVPSSKVCVVRVVVVVTAPMLVVNVLKGVVVVVVVVVVVDVFVMILVKGVAVVAVTVDTGEEPVGVGRPPGQKHTESIGYMSAAAGSTLNNRLMLYCEKMQPALNLVLLIIMAAMSTPGRSKAKATVHASVVEGPVQGAEQPSTSNIGQTSVGIVEKCGMVVVVGPPV